MFSRMFSKKSIPEAIAGSTPASEENLLLQQPNELLLLQLSFLSWKELLLLQSVSKRIKTLIEDDSLWHQFGVQNKNEFKDLYSNVNEVNRVVAGSSEENKIRVFVVSKNRGRSADFDNDHDFIKQIRREERYQGTNGQALLLFHHVALPDSHRFLVIAAKCNDTVFTIIVPATLADAKGLLEYYSYSTESLITYNEWVVRSYPENPAANRYNYRGLVFIFTNNATLEQDLKSDRELMRRIQPERIINFTHKTVKEALAEMIAVTKNLFPLDTPSLRNTM